MLGLGGQLVRTAWTRVSTAAPLAARVPPHSVPLYLYPPVLSVSARLTPSLWLPRLAGSACRPLHYSDLGIRLQPTLLTCSRRVRVVSCSAGERHSAIVVSHIPMTWRDEPSVREYFKILEVIELLPRPPPHSRLLAND